MAKSKTYTTQLKRKIRKKTNYKKRLSYLKSGKIRLVIRPSTNNITFQAVEFNVDGDNVLNTTKGKDIKRIGWKYSTGNIPAAYLTGLLFGTKIKDTIKEGVVDLGLYSITKGARLPAAIKGIADSGVNINYDESICPSKEDLSGKRIVEFAKKLATEKEKYEKQFSKYLKNNLKPEEISKQFEEVKNKILGNKNETTK
ncbi:50S ribosomal protein L18 [archaeon]|nr:50S ribosomal protein L18 [archaeon]